jgi:energy-converting hydrogenase Eha subunit G
MARWFSPLCLSTVTTTTAEWFLSMNASSLIDDVKVAITVILTGLGTGLSMFLALIPNDIGKLASLVAIVLTGILIRNHLRNGRKLDLENRKLQIEVAQLEAKEVERAALAADRKKRGLPIRRSDEH